MYGNFYNFLITVLENKRLDNVKLLQIRFLEDLMVDLWFTKNLINQSKNQIKKNLCLLLSAYPNKTVNNLFLNTSTNKHNKEIYLQTQILFNLREKTFKKLVNKRIIKNDFDQSDIVRQKYEESIAEKAKSEPELKPNLGNLLQREQNQKNKNLMKLLKKKR